MSKLFVKTGDKVQVINGKDRGVVGKVKAVSPKEGKVIVEGVNIIVRTYSDGSTQSIKVIK